MHTGRPRCSTRTRAVRSARRRRLRSWTPPYCLHPACSWHKAEDTTGWRFQLRGARATARDPELRNPRFRCLTCGHWFCRSGFTHEYRKKVPRRAERVFPLLNNGCGLRQAGRILGLSPTTIQRTQRQIAAHAALFLHAQEQRLKAQLHEPVVLDGQRNLIDSVYQMAEINTLYTADSGYAIALSAFGIRQGVGRSEEKLSRRERSEVLWGRPDPAARRKDTQQLMARIDALIPRPATVEIRTDEEPDYLPPIRRLMRRRRVRHVRVSSRARRDGANPLWMANHKHRLARHSLANLRRQTIAQSKRLSGLQDRLLVHQLWLNFAKGDSERTKQGRQVTPAMKLGLADHKLTVEELFRERLLPAREGLPAEWLVAYEGRGVGWPNEDAVLRGLRQRA